MAHGPTPWPKGRKRLRIAKQVGYTRPTNARDLGHIVLLAPTWEELAFRGPTLLAAWMIGVEAAIFAALISTIIFCAMHWKTFGNDIGDYVKALPSYIVLSVVTSVCVIIGSTNWGFTGAFWGMVIAIAYHAFCNGRVELDEHCQRKYRFSPFGELNALIQRMTK